MFTFDIINATGATLDDNFMKMVPFGIPVTYILDVNAPGVNERIVPQKIMDDHEDFPCLNVAGMEFPVIDVHNSRVREKLVL